jgi:hypothetical protein
MYYIYTYVSTYMYMYIYVYIIYIWKYLMMMQLVGWQLRNHKVYQKLSAGHQGIVLSLSWHGHGMPRGLRKSVSQRFHHAKMVVAAAAISPKKTGW